MKLGCDVLWQAERAASCFSGSDSEASSDESSTSGDESDDAVEVVEVPSQWEARYVVVGRLIVGGGTEAEEFGLWLADDTGKVAAVMRPP